MTDEQEQAIAADLAQIEPPLWGARNCSGSYPSRLGWSQATDLGAGADD
jgi:hypothetical protein